MKGGDMEKKKMVFSNKQTQALMNELVPEKTFEKPKATLKAYPIKEIQKNQEHWKGGQERKTLTVRFVEKPTQELMDEVYKRVVAIGFGAINDDTFSMNVNLEDMGTVQQKLSEIFDLTYLVKNDKKN